MIERRSLIFSVVILVGILTKTLIAAQERKYNFNIKPTVINSKI